MQSFDEGEYSWHGCGAVALFKPMSKTHKSTIVKLFIPKEDESYGTQKET